MNVSALGCTGKGYGGDPESLENRWCEQKCDAGVINLESKSYDVDAGGIQIYSVA